METSNDRLTYLFSAWYGDTATTAEAAEFKQLLQQNDITNADLEKLMRVKWNAEDNTNDFFVPKVSDRMLKKILQDRKEITPIKRMGWWRTAAAAAILLLVSLGGYFYFNSGTEKQIATTETQEQRFKNDVAPGGNKAVLTLSDGSQIILDSAKNGTLTQQGNTKILKLDDGKLTYNSTNANAEILYNTISTPKGGQYQIALADGSKVWLNAASSLKFPTAFNGKERIVELTGEAYFEVSKSAAKPFTVNVNDMNVQVLGTHFNINAYNDEAVIKTTLLEGSVKINKGSFSTILQPGQQAQVAKEIKVVNDIAVDDVLAWKNGFFSFNKADLQTVMRQIARWYDVEISYEGKIPTREFGGKINRNSNASEVLKILEESKVHFRIEGKKIVVMP